MPVDFRLSEIIISQFRGIRELTLELPDNIPTYVVGPNNSGKSTILNALALSMRGGGFHTFTPKAFDFFHSTDGSSSSDFRIDLLFKADKEEYLPAVQGVGNPTIVHGIRVLGRTDKSGHYRHRHVLIDHNHEAITQSPRTPLKGNLKEKFKDHELGWTQYYAQLDDIAKHLPTVWFLKPDNLYKSLFIWQTGPLQRLSKILTDRFLNTEWEFEFDGDIRQMPSTLKTAYNFFKSCVAEFPFWTKELKPKLEKTLGTYLGKSAKLALQPDILVFNDWLQQQLAVSFSAEATGPLTPLSSMGDGWQALVRLASLEVLSEFEDDRTSEILLLCEEPEIYLHPHLRRKLRSILNRLASNGWLVVTSTHAPELLSFQVPQYIVRIWKNEEDTGRGHLFTEDIADATRFQEKLEEYGNHEILLANRNIFCEGKDDVFAMKTFFNKSQVDLDALGVTILGVGGCSSLPDYARMSNKLGIPWCALTDEDLMSDGSEKPNTAEIRDQLQNIAEDNDLIPTWPNSLETCLECTQRKATPDWQEENISPLSIKKLRSKYPKFISTCDKIKAWLE